ncbi:hypothetical protein JAAARDRAFT_61286 [Jaapia argillacea MUCL 33604]|uniref:DDE Tnp4 domain-containing protein n=1 Tax=Jaapia argillacea MUCL 33604 TaxID=933084 RepID=A0A067PTA4_9AGAM|nr:hypothetical protein JAAARDRAFT_61286 [Jaapia argillacea MUCL 33604]
MLPNGIIGHLYGPMEGRRNDAFMLTESGLLQQFATFTFREDVGEDAPTEERNFYIFGDPAYGVGPHILSPYAGAGERTEEEGEWNAEMASVRIEVEHGFGIVANTWLFLNASWKMQLYHSPYFDCEPPELKDYFHPAEVESGSE